jgi:hypothetical protein
LEEILDLVPLGIEVRIEGRLDGARSVGLDMGLRPEVILDHGPQVACVAGRVGNDMADTLEPLDQRGGLRAIAALPGRRDQPHGKPEGIDACADLRRQAAARASDALSLSPPLAPVASAWTLQIVLSIRTYSKSGSSAKLLKRRSQTPESAHRRKRAWTPVHLPNSGGRSRHGEAVRASHSTASTKSRLSVPLRPGMPSRPGSCQSIRAHCASLKVRLLKIASVFLNLTPPIP